MFLDNFRQFFARLTRRQQATLGAAVVGVLAVLIAVAYWANRPDYALLFGRLDASDAGRIVEVLREERVAYQLRDGGTAVYVPQKEVYDLRLRMASRGLVSEGPIGYELFDGGTLGMTDFLQKLNHKRALEGELARTVGSVDGVMQARVHLVLPERSAFRERQVQPSASVVLGLRSGAQLDRERVNGIASLVAGAVEGLQPRDVTILDARGNLLSDPELGNADVQLSSTQLRTRRAVEEHLAQSGQTMLDRVVGAGRAVVRVSADLDFSRTVEERDEVDPDATVILSEERLQEQSLDGETGSTVRNYEVSRSRTRSERAAGQIAGLSVSVVLDQRITPDANGEPAASPISAEELAEIENLVKNAVGFRAERGDRFAIHQTRFDTTHDDAFDAFLREQEEAERVQRWIRTGLVALVLIVLALLFRATARRVTGTDDTEPVRLVARPLDPAGDRPPIAGATGAAAAPRALPAADDDEVVVADYFTSKLSDEARARLHARQALYEETKQQATEQPEAVADTIRAWLAEDTV